MWTKTMQDKIVRPKRASGEVSRGIMIVAYDLYIETERTGRLCAKTCRDNMELMRQTRRERFVESGDWRRKGQMIS